MPTLAETWLEQGREQGREQGIVQGELLHARRTLQKLLIQKFGPLPDAVNKRIDTANQETLETWTDQVLSVSSLQALFPDS